MRGDHEAVASAYALHDYQIATDLGGADAYANLRDRAWQRGVRLASDMVPNHVGIDGRWVIDPQIQLGGPSSAFAPTLNTDTQAVDLIRRGRWLRATDIHIDPYDDRESCVRMRIDGRLQGDHEVLECLYIAHLDHLSLQSQKVVLGLDELRREVQLVSWPGSDLSP